MTSVMCGMPPQMDVQPAHVERTDYHVPTLSVMSLVM